MPSYAAPTFAYWKELTGISREIEQDATDTDLQAFFTGQLSRVEAEISGLVTDTTFESASLTAKQVLDLQGAVCYRMGSDYLGRIMAQGDTGTAAPIGIGGRTGDVMGRDVAETITYFNRRVRFLVLLVLGGDYLTRARLEPAV